MSTRLGISPFASTRAGMAAIAALAVEGGIDTLWMGDGLLANPDFPDWSGATEPFTTLAWLAGRLPTASVGITAAALPLRDIVWTAKQAATLDRVCDGRSVLVVAPGFWDHELEFRGIDVARRGEMFRDGVVALRAALAGEGHAGPAATFPGTHRIAPVPTRAIPLWLAGAERTRAFAVEQGLPFQASRVSPADLAPIAERWFGEGGGELGVRVRISVADRAPAGENLAWNALAGPASYLADQLAAYAELGVTDVSLIPGQDDHSSLATVATLVNDVVPALGGVVAPRAAPGPPG